MPVIWKVEKRNIIREEIDEADDDLGEEKRLKLIIHSAFN